MALLKPSLFALALASCYSPDIEDCTVSCSRPTDCAPSQVCGADGYCAHEAVAGRCAMIASPDANTGDAADAMPDSMVPTVKLVVRIEGRGDVHVTTVGTCDGGSGQIECTYHVAKDLPLTLQATPKNLWRFERWDDACKDAPTETCVITPSKDAHARARFAEVDDD